MTPRELCLFVVIASLSIAGAVLLTAIALDLVSIPNKVEVAQVVHYHSGK